MRTKKMLFYILTILLGGCIPVISLNSFYKPLDVTFDKNLLGTWVNEPNNPTNTWVFSQNDDPNIGYNFEFTDEEGRKGSFVANLFNLEKIYFLDVYPAELPWDPDDPNKVEFFYNTFLMIPAHSIIKVDSIGTELKVRLTETDKLKDLLDENPGVIRYKAIEDRIILTASTEELQTFITKYSEDDRLFPDRITMYRLGAEVSKP
jgi:hypothetical protein